MLFNQQRLSKIIIFLLLSIILTGLSFKPNLVYAQNDAQKNIADLQKSSFGLDQLAIKIGLCKEGTEKGVCQDTADLRQILMRLLQIALGFTSLIALIIVIYGGFTWATAGGSPERVKKGRDILVWASVGLVVLVSAWSIISYVMYLSSQIA
jgi:hypothetical protein